MNLALLGDDPAIWPLLARLFDSPKHRLVAASLCGTLQSRLEAARPTVRITDRWDEFLVGGTVDAVLVASGSPSVLEAARRLAAEGKPLLLAPQGGQTAFIYELSLVRDEARTPLAPLFLLRYETALEAARARAAAGDFGRILHLKWERTWPVDPAGGLPLLTPDDVENALLGDADLLRQLGGNYDRVTALQSGVVDGKAAAVTVTLAGDGLPEATWNLTAVAASSTGDPAMIGPTGDWTLTLNGAAGQHTAESRSSTPGIERLFDAFEEAVRGTPAGPSWNDLLRASETVDAARRSLSRRRTIDLHFETTSERSQFKTQMTAIGCSVLVLTLALVLLLMLIGSAVAVPPGIMRVARIAVFAPLFIYLALQLLLFIARPPSDG